MSKFVHLHVHSQYSILDGQASIQRLVDKAMADGQPGIAVTDHGDMFGIKEFYNYVKKQNGKKHDKIKTLKKLSAGLEKLLAEGSDPAARLRQLKEELAALEGRKNDSPEDAEACAAARARVEEVESMQKEFGFDPAAAQEKIAGLEAVPDFKPIIGCEVYVARRRLHDKEGKPDQSGYHLILLAKNLKGYHNLIKIVSKAWTDGFYMRPRTDRTEIEKYHEGLICCSACLGGEVPQAIMHNDIEEAERVVQWFKNIFGEDYYLELQLHPSGDPQKDADVYENQLRVNKVILELAAKYGVKYICSNDVHFILAEDAVALFRAAVLVQLHKCVGVDKLLGQLGREVARRDAVDGDVVLAPVVGQGLGHHVHAALGGAVRCGPDRG